MERQLNIFKNGKENEILDAIKNESEQLKKELNKKDSEISSLITERDGISKETLNGSDHIAIIPMQNGVDSLNVAASSAVAFWQLGKH